MQLSNTLPSLESATRTIPIKDWSEAVLAENPILVDKITVNTEISSRHDVPGSVEETIKFLYLCATCETTLTPSILVDQVWHEFILFTRSYQHFCTGKLGRFVHHQPSDNSVENSAQYEMTLRAYRQYFGEPPTRYWPQNTSDIADCGSCED